MSWDDIKRQYGGGSNSGGWENVKAQWQAGAPARALKQQEEQQRQRAALQLAERSAQTARDAVEAVRNGLTRQPAARSGGANAKDDADTVMRERFAQGRAGRQGQRLTDGATKQTHAEARKAEKQERAAQFADAAKQYVDIAVPAIAQGAALRIVGPRGQQRMRERAEEWQRYRDGYDSGRSVETVQAEYEKAQADAANARAYAKNARSQSAGYQQNGAPTQYQNTTRQQNSARNSAKQWDSVAAEAEEKAKALATELGYAKTFYLTDKYASLAENPDFAEKSKPVEQNPGETKRPGDYEVDQSLSETYEANMPEIDIVQYRVNHNGQSPASAGTVHQEDAFMTDDERATFNYLYNTGRKDDALEYYNALSDTLEMRRGAQTAKDWDSTAARTVYNFGAGINRWVRGVGQLFTDEALPATSVDYAQGIMNSEAGRGGRILYSAANSLGNMLPSVILSAATSGAAGALGASAKVAETAGKAASTASMFAGAKGNAYTEALRQGMTKAEAGTYSTLVGASEAGLEYLLGGISKLGVNPIGEAAEKWVSDLGTGYAKAILGPTGKLLGSAAGEILEENIQNYLEPIFLNAVTGEEGDMPGWDEFIETTLSVLITVGLMEGPGTVSSINTNMQTTIPEMQRQWVDSALEVFPEGSPAWMTASALSERLNREESIPVQEFRAELRQLGLSESAMAKIRSGKVTLEEVQQAMTEIQRGKYAVKPRNGSTTVSADAAEVAQEVARSRTAAGNAAPVYMAYGFKEDAAAAAAAVTAKMEAGETLTNAEVGALRLKTQRGREALSAILGIEIDSPQAFRKAELFYQQGRAAQEWNNVQLDVATLPATQESAVAILGNEQALSSFETMLERSVSGVWQARVEQVIKGLKELQAGRGENAQTVSATEQWAAYASQLPQIAQAIDWNGPEGANFRDSVRALYKRAGVQDKIPNTSNLFAAIGKMLAGEKLTTRQIEGLNLSDPAYRRGLELVTGLHVDIPDGANWQTRGSAFRAAEASYQEARRYARDSGLRMSEAALDPAGLRAAQLNIDNAAANGYNQSINENGGAANGLYKEAGRRVSDSVSGRSESRGALSQGRNDGPGNLGVSRVVLLSEAARKTFEQRGIVPAEFSSADNAAFSSALTAARDADARNGWAVTPEPGAELDRRGVRSFLTGNGTSGFAITPDGDIIGVFSNKAAGAPKGMTWQILPTAVENGGVKLDCYGERLVNLYEDNGFVPVARVEFNPEYANPGWTADKGSPDIYFMMHNGDSPDTIVQKQGKYQLSTQEELNELPVMSYDEAAAYRDKLISKQRGSDTTSVGAAPSGFDPLSHAANEYGAIPPGENPRGDNHIVDIPKSMDGKTKVQQGTRTFIEASATQDVNMIEDAIVQGMFNRRGWNFDEMRQQATEWLNERTPTQAVVEWTSDNAKKQTAQNFARGVLLYADLQKLWAAAEKGSSERKMYHDMSLEVMASLNDSATRAGEVLALMRLVKRLNPADRVELIQRGINSLNATLPNGVQVEMNPELVEAYYQALNSEDEQAIRLAEENLKRDIAAQVPKTLADRWNAWRYLCMLGNPKTIIRNVAGNLGMTGVKRLRDTVGAGLELFIPKEERTKATLWARNSKKGRALAEFISKNYYTDEVQNALRGEGKYSQNLENSLRQMIREQNGTFTAPVLKQWQAVTEWAMNDASFGDAGFLRHHYVNSFVQAALARGYTAEDFARKGGIPQEVVNELQSYAVNQAQKATFRDLNSFSRLMKKLPNKDNFWGIVMQGILPFRSTPANVAVRSVEYSPLGIAQGIQQLVRYALDKRADKPLSYSKSQIIESFSQGIVGTALFGAGFVLANAGVIHGAADDDDERKGIQAYSITIGNKNITLDWLSPSIVPLMMGAMASDMSADGAYTLDALATSAGTMLQPMFEMSMLSGVSDLLDSFRYADSSNDATGIVWGLFCEPFMNYLSQGIPTLLSQTTQTIGDESTYTYTGDLPTGFQKKLTKSVWKMLRKTPLSLVFDDRQAEFVDEYGRTQDKGNVVERFFNSFLNPAYVSDVMETDLDAELERLEESTGTNAAPTRRGYTITVNGERKRLTKDQYDRYSLEYGTQAAEMMGALLVSKQYDEMTDEERVGAFEKVGQLADKYGKISAGVGYTVKDGDSDKALFDLVDSGIPVAEAYAARLYRDQLNRDSILDATTRQERFSAWVSGQSGWGQKQKDAVLDAYGTFFTQTPANTEKYEASAKIVGTDKAMQVSDAIRALQPEQKTDAKYEYDRAKDDTASKTYSAVRTVQRIELIAKQSGVSDKDKYALMELYTTDWRCEEFRQAGLAPKVYAEFLRGKDEYCPSGQWSDKRFAQWLAGTSYSAEVKNKIRTIYNMDKP